MEEQQATETEDHCSYGLVNMTRPETLKRKNSLSRYKLATEMEKLHETDTYEHCSI